MLLPAVLLGLVLVTGCSTATTGAPTPVSPVQRTSDEPSSPAESSADLPADGAPSVAEPLDTTRYQREPCRSLTATQAAELNVRSPGQPYKTVLGNACEWRGNSDRRAQAHVRFLSENPRGLSAEYKADKDGKWAFFEEMHSIEGYPAVARGGIDDRNSGSCTVVTGTSNENSFEIFLQLSSANVGLKNPCEVAAQVAGMVLRTMRADQ